MSEKTRFLPMAYAKTKAQISFAVTAKLISTFFHYTDSTIPLFLKSEISSFYPSSVAAQAGLCQTWSETPKTGFLPSGPYVWALDDLNLHRLIGIIADV